MLEAESINETLYLGITTVRTNFKNALRITALGLTSRQLISIRYMLRETIGMITIHISVLIEAVDYKSLI